MQNIKQQIEKYIIWIIFLGGFLIRIYNINFLNIWRDESFSINVARFPLSRVIEVAAKDTQPPLHLISLHFWMQLFGDDARSVRMLSVVFGMITVFFTYKIAQKVFQDKKYIVIATILAAVNPLLIFYSQEARAYSMLTAFTAAIVYFALKLKKESKLINYIGLAISGIAGLYTHNIFIFVLSTITILKVVELIRVNGLKIKQLIKENKSYLLKLLGSYIIIGLAYVPWFIVFMKQYSKVDSEGFWLTFDPIADIIKNSLPFFTSSNFDQNFTWIDDVCFFIIGLFGVPLTVLGIIKEISDRKNKFPYVSFLLLGMLGTVWLISFKLPFYYIRYIIFVTPLVLLGFTYGLKSLVSTLNEKGVTILAVIFILASTVLQLTNVAQNYNSKEDYRNGIAYIDENYNPTTDLIMHGNALTLHSFLYYSDKKSFIYDPDRSMQFWQGLAYIEDKDYLDTEIYSERVWVMWMWPYDTLQNALVEQKYEKVSTKEFAGGLKVDLWGKSKPETPEFASL